MVSKIIIFKILPLYIVPLRKSWFQLIKAEGEAIHKSLAVKTEEINKAIADFPLTISHPIRDVKNSSEKPYSWLIKERKSNKAGDL